MKMSLKLVEQRTIEFNDLRAVYTILWQSSQLNVGVMQILRPLIALTTNS